ncbi:MAG: DUF3566 domain-containing protein [Ornithinimicrobium sp.]|uniref:DUF3566 domain-containing protein n=1 Tax=Ornithinimicrobium sp. TaxID=1977084 RepID=UPI0026E10428|nr:DUF3566 domain-containing protein [Ornithinimicrobium sp.]MDO5739174.1 DUF3566 domain-containing protein [Ornithinimicrobium sp.]
MSTDAQAGSTTSGDETAVSADVSADDVRERAGGDADGQADDERSTAAKMRDGAMARTAQGRDLASRRARALRGATAGLASGSAAGASASRGSAASGRVGGLAAGSAAGGSGPGGSGLGTSTAGSSSARTSGNTVRPQPRAPRRGGPRRVRLTAQRVDPWSVLKISFLVSVALGIAGVVMIAVLWTVLSGMNVFSTISDFFTRVTSGETGGASFDLMDYLGVGRVISLAAVMGVLNVFLLTALATLTAFLYNICAALVGGAQVTLSDE